LKIFYAFLAGGEQILWHTPVEIFMNKHDDDVYLI
jgi:hypothetical protein